MTKIATVVFVGLSLAVAAGCSKPANTNNPAVAAEQNRSTPSPAAGNNSFTEGQAEGHLTNAGYSNVTEMTQDEKGVWHGKATKNGKTTAVSVDYQGSVTEH